MLPVVVVVDADADDSTIPHADPIADAAANVTGLFPPSCSTTGYSDLKLVVVVVAAAAVEDVNVNVDKDDDDVAKS